MRTVETGILNKIFIDVQYMCMLQFGILVEQTLVVYHFGNFDQMLLLLLLNVSGNRQF